MSEVRISVEDSVAFFERARAAARRIDIGNFAEQRGEISFETTEMLLKILTPNRWALLRTLRRSGPTSIRALGKDLTRDYRGVHADVTALRNAGLIEKDQSGKVRVPWSKITAEMSVDMAA